MTEKTSRHDYTIGESLLYREGYEISSWNTKSDGSGEMISLDKTFNISSDNTIYAMWKELDVLKTSENEFIVDDNGNLISYS